MTFAFWPILYILLLFIFQVLQKVFCLYHILHSLYCGLCPPTWCR